MDSSLYLAQFSKERNWKGQAPKVRPTNSAIDWWRHTASSMILCWCSHHTITRWIRLTICCVSSRSFNRVSGAQGAAGSFIEISGMTNYKIKIPTQFHTKRKFVIFSQTIIINLFTNQSEVSALPSECFSIKINVWTDCFHFVRSKYNLVTQLH